MSRRRPTWIVLPGLAGLLLCYLSLAGGPTGQASAVGVPTLTHRHVLPLLAADDAGAVQSFSIAFMDVGQGDAILVTVNGHRLLVDGGPSRDRLRDRLQALGVSDLDGILVTNPDADHIRGLTEALSLFSVEHAYTSGSTNPSQTYQELLAAIAGEPGIEIATVRRGSKIEVGGLDLDVLNPDVLTGDRNRDSIALKLSCGQVSLLLMGDATTASEASMIAAGLISDVDVLKAGHHGSKTSTSQQFLDAARPEYVVFSAGLGNIYGHPSPEVVQRVASIGAEAIYTDTTAGDDTKILSSDCRTYSFSSVGGGGQTPTPGPSATIAPTRTGTPTATPTGTAGTCAGASAVITTLDKVAEVVTLNISGNMTGWRLVSATGNQTFAFPSGFVGNGTVQVRSNSPVFANTATTLWWTSTPVWNNSANDDALLYDCAGRLVQTFDDGS